LLQCVFQRNSKGDFGPYFRASIYYDTVLVLPNKGNFQFFEHASYYQRVINTEIYLAKMKATNGSDQRFAIKVMKKSHIISCCNVSSTVTEKEALVLPLGHPFIMTL
jgi:hypothetical protein